MGADVIALASRRPAPPRAGTCRACRPGFTCHPHRLVDLARDLRRLQAAGAPEALLIPHDDLADVLTEVLGSARRHHERADSHRRKGHPMTRKPSPLPVLDPEAERAHAVLTVALLDLTDRGERVPCHGDTRFTGKRPPASLTDLCALCPVLDACRTAGEHERWGVWAGTDRAADRRRP